MVRTTPRAAAPASMASRRACRTSSAHQPPPSRAERRLHRQFGARRSPVSISRLPTLPQAISRTSTPTPARRPARCPRRSARRLPGGSVAEHDPIGRAPAVLERSMRCGPPGTPGWRARSHAARSAPRRNRAVPGDSCCPRWSASPCAIAGLSSGTQTSTGSSSTPAKPRGPTATTVCVRRPSRRRPADDVPARRRNAAARTHG